MATFRFVLTGTLVMILLAMVLPARAATPMDRVDFDAAAEQAAPMSGPAYAYVRCAGLFRSVRLHAGRKALGADRWDYALQVEAAFERRSALLRVEDQGQPWRSARVQTEQDVVAMTRLYLARYRAMIETNGRPWSRDALWAEDNRTCGALVERLDSAQ